MFIYKYQNSVYCASTHIHTHDICMSWGEESVYACSSLAMYACMFVVARTRVQASVRAGMCTPRLRSTKDPSDKRDLILGRWDHDIACIDFSVLQLDSSVASHAVQLLSV